jgi:hypothetical protein
MGDPPVGDLLRRSMKPSRVFLACLAGLASALAFTALPAGQARAFTFESANGVTADGSANLADPDAQFEGMSKGNSTMSMPGGVTMHFGPQNSQGNYDENYRSGVNRMFNSLGDPNN